MIECILFDSDGTLVDSELISMQALAGVFEPYGVQLDVDSLHHTYRGWKMGEAIELLGAQYGLDLPGDFERGFRRLQQQLLAESLQPVPGVPQLLAELDLPMAVVTSGPMPKVRLALEVTGLARYFGDRLYSAYQVGVWKPDPEIYRIAARDMGFEIERCLAVEDSPIGLEAAATCGAVPVFLNRFGDRVGYDNVIEIGSMGELSGVLGCL